MGLRLLAGDKLSTMEKALHRPSRLHSAPEDRMKKLIWTLALMLCLGCASLPTFPPRLPDGALDVVTLVDYASYGIEADCALGFNLDVCTFGRQTIGDARRDIALDPEHPRAALAASLARSVARWPLMQPYVQFVRDAVA